MRVFEVVCSNRFDVDEEIEYTYTIKAKNIAGVLTLAMREQIDVDSIVEIREV